MKVLRVFSSLDGISSINDSSTKGGLGKDQKERSNVCCFGGRKFGSCYACQRKI